MHPSLFELLQDLSIQCPGDFRTRSRNEKLDITKRLHSSIVSDATQALEDLKYVAGVKLHFNVTLGSEGDFENVPGAVFLRKAAFFATKTIVSFPFYQTYKDDTPVDRLLTLVSDIQPLLQSGFVTVIPSELGTGKVKPTSFCKKYDLISANFSLRKLQAQFEESGLAVVGARILLPYFTEFEADDIIQGRKREAKLYQDYECRLFEKLRCSDLGHEQQLFEELETIDKEIDRLENKYQSIKREDEAGRFPNLAEMAKTRIGLTMLMPEATRARLIEFIHAHPEYRAVYGDIVDSLYYPSIDGAKDWELEECYLLWRVKHLASHRK